MTQTATAYGNGENWGLLQDEEQNLALMVPGTELPEGILTEATFDMVLEDAKTGETVGTVPVTVGMNLDPSAQ